MKNLNMNEIRSEFLKFFEEKEHLILKSYSLIPEHDKSLLLINAGMAPLKRYFTGEFKMAKDRAASSQRCIRTGDIDQVGITHRHGTFFEMLGNFSFGDYFKREAITWAWEFLTEKMEIPDELLWASVYLEDDEAYDIWKNEIGLPEERIVRLGKEDNFWELEEGPCGPCSEIHVDRGEEFGCGDPDCKPGCDCDRYLEVWNLVFTQFNKDANGEYHPLEHKNIDTGMGLERIALVLEGANNIFEVSVIKNIIDAIERKANIKYEEDSVKDVSIRIIADHIRAATFLIYDGIIPSNEGRGYVLRRLIRRASRHGKFLGVKGVFLTEISKAVMSSYSGEYPELTRDQERIFKILETEELKFQETLEQGLKHLESIMDREEGNTISGENAFKLYDTFGFPYELTKEISEEKGYTVDEETFKKLMEEQKTRSRSAREDGDNEAWEKTDNIVIKKLDGTEFLGYSELASSGKILRIFKEGKETDRLVEGEKGIIVLDRSPFYGESGGQVGDIGFLRGEFGFAEVRDTQKNKNAAILHHVEVAEGSLSVKDKVEAEVDIMTRRDTMKNHSATHLLNKALREVLGEHINQAGSYVDSKRLRFDLTHFEGISKEDLKRIEEIVNEQIALGLPVAVREKSLVESQEEGAIGLFEDKYKDVVRVVNMGNGYSVELCGGTHVSTTSDIQMLKIMSESSVASGIRRIEAITGREVYKHMTSSDRVLSNVGTLLKAAPEELDRRIIELQSENKGLQKEVHNLKQEESAKSLNDVLDQAAELSNGSKVVAFQFEDMDMDTIRGLGDKIRDQIASGVIVLSTVKEGKLNFIAMVTKDLIEKGVFAGNIVKQVAQITGGNGGGRKDFAAAGGKDISKVDEALGQVKTIVEQML